MRTESWAIKVKSKWQGTPRIHYNFLLSLRISYFISIFRSLYVSMVFCVCTLQFFNSHGNSLTWHYIFAAIIVVLHMKHSILFLLATDYNFINTILIMFTLKPATAPSHLISSPLFEYPSGKSQPLHEPVLFIRTNFFRRI